MNWDKAYQRKKKYQEEQRIARELAEDQAREAQLLWNRKMEEWTPEQSEKWKKRMRDETERIREQAEYLEKTKPQYEEYRKKIRKEFGLDD